MSYKYVKIGSKSYVFRRMVTDEEMEVFKTHRGANNYFFKVRGNQIAFYVSNQPMSNITGHPEYKPCKNIKKNK